LQPFKTTGYGLGVSAETGKPFRFEHGWFIEPQAQVIYQRIGFNDGIDNGALVSFSNVESLAGRIGARFGRAWSLDQGNPRGRQLTVWLRPNLWHEFLGNPVTTFSSADGPVPFRSSLGGTWGEINLGVSGQVSLNTTLFANASYQSRFDGGGFSYNGKAGVRFNW
jgi:outer membrane autotransporter protein